MTATAIKLQEAFTFYERGQPAHAKTVCEELLMTEPACADALHLLGIIESQSNRQQRAIELFNRAIAADANRPAFYANRGNALLSLAQFNEAIQSYDQAISINPSLADVHFNRGNALLALEQIEAAIDSYSQAININPNFAQAYGNRGNALQALKRFSEAVENYNRAISINPNYVNAYFNRGNAFEELNQLDKAIESYGRTISLNSSYSEAYFNRGNVLQKLKRLKDAVENYNRAIEINPNYFEAYVNRGSALMQLKQFQKAVENYTQAINIKPNFVDGLVNRGFAQQELKQFEAAVKDYDQAIAINPNCAEAHFNRGNVLLMFKQLEAAVSSYDRAITIKPDYAKAYGNRGNTLQTLRHFEAAVASYEKALALNPAADYLLSMLIHCKMSLCDWQELEKNVAKLIERIERGEKASSGFPLLPLTTSLLIQRKVAELFTADQHPADSSLGDIAKHEKSEKIRIGYFSADFHFHPISILLAEVFELHDKKKFHVVVFNFGPENNDALQQRIKNAVDQFIDVHQQSNQEVAQLARLMKIDIAIDLMGNTTGARTGIFSCRAAPIQVNYLGYPSTMGADYYDYLIADQTIIPDATQHHYIEKIAYLPNSYQPNDSRREVSEGLFSRSELGLPETGFVFCCFNSNYKITPQVFDSWMRILSSVKGSVLLLFADSTQVSQNLKKEAQHRGVDPDRLVFAERLPFADYVARYKTADLFLNTFPYNAGTTASDALWAGLPVLTWSGETFVSRVTASLLNAVGLPELITESQESYEQAAIALATNPDKLTAIKAKLAANKTTTALFNTPLFTRHLEAAYAAMVERYQADLTPDHIFIDGVRVT